MNRIRYISGLILLSAGFALVAQDAKFTASVSPATVRIGQQFSLTVTGTEQGQVMLPDVSGLELIRGPFTSVSHSSNWVNGKITSTSSFTNTYIMRSRNEGEITIPPIKVKTKSSGYTTNPVTLNVLASDAGNAATVQQGSTAGTNQTQTEPTQDPIFMRIVPSSREVYVGEQFISEIKVFSTVGAQRNSNDTKAYEGFYKQSLDADAQPGNEIINGNRYMTLVIQRDILIPQKAGEIEIKSYESEWVINQRVERRRPRSAWDDFFDDPFNDPFFDSYNRVNRLLATPPVTIKVKPLPAGAPEGFSGAVGSFKVNTSLSEDTVAVNDALTYKVTISGTGNLALIGKPQIDFPPDHDVYDATKQQNISTSGNRINGSITFEYPIVARHAGKYRIPALTFSWFDPKTEKYKTVTTEEYSFIVKKSGEVIDEGTTVISGVTGSDVEKLGSDILDIARTAPAFLMKQYSPLSKTWYWLIYIGLVILATALGIFMHVTNRQRANIRLTRTKQANKMARRRLKRAFKAMKADDSNAFYEEVEKAIWGYLGDKLSMDTADLSRDSISSLIGDTHIAGDLQDELYRIMDGCELSRYAPKGEGQDMETLYNDAIQLIRKLDKNLS